MGDEQHDNRFIVLRMIEERQISTEEGLELLDALNGTYRSGELPTELDREEDAVRPEMPQMGEWWLVPTVAGSIVMVIGVPLVAMGISGRAAIYWALCCGWMPFLIGLALVTLGVWSRNARWLHIRITSPDTGRRTIPISLPLPLGLTALMLKIARPFVPKNVDVPIDEMVMALQEAWRSGDDEPIFIEVNDGDEHVLIYIG